MDRPPDAADLPYAEDGAHPAGDEDAHPAGDPAEDDAHPAHPAGDPAQARGDVPEARSNERDPAPEGTGRPSAPADSAGEAARVGATQGAAVRDDAYWDPSTWDDSVWLSGTRTFTKEGAIWIFEWELGDADGYVRFVRWNALFTPDCLQAELEAAKAAAPGSDPASPGERAASGIAGEPVCDPAAAPESGRVRETGKAREAAAPEDGAVGLSDAPASDLTFESGPAPAPAPAPACDPASASSGRSGEKPGVSPVPVEGRATDAAVPGLGRNRGAGEDRNRGADAAASALPGGEPRAAGSAVPGWRIAAQAWSCATQAIASPSDAVAEQPSVSAGDPYRSLSGARGSGSPAIPAIGAVPAERGGWSEPEPEPEHVQAAASEELLEQPRSLSSQTRQITSAGCPHLDRDTLSCRAP